ncbi:glucose-1-phosphate adenylyltransferase large subunit 1-like [Hibiscus syriacus]|uniref:glucose-1-phosphate adenylyltransferase large subunit 1-like n=1 Tax=Hibiscus syriacus TaxID=106335 RepID=UPI0019236F9A|nr:glucose-1-phosphate adenylyltransferase large subunit 1-like [Hibiscus syriacus]
MTEAAGVFFDVTKGIEIWTFHDMFVNAWRLRYSKIMVETDNAESHVDNNADITISCVTMGNSRASDYGLVTIDGRGRIVQFSEKPKGADLKAMQTDTTLLGLSPQEALKSPYIASMEVYIFKTEVLLKLLRWRFPASNDFGSEIIPAAVEEHDVQVRAIEMEIPFVYDVSPSLLKRGTSSYTSEASNRALNLTGKEAGLSKCS